MNLVQFYYFKHSILNIEFKFQKESYNVWKLSKKHNTHKTMKPSQRTVLNTTKNRKRLVRPPTKSIRVTFTFLCKADDGHIGAKQHCCNINTVVFHGGLQQFTVCTDAAVDTWPLLVSPNESSCPSVRLLCINTLDNCSHGIPSYCDIPLTAVHLMVFWVMIPFLRGTRCLHHLST